MESEPSFEWSELEGHTTDEERIGMIAYDLIIAHIEVFHPGLVEKYYLEEEERKADGRDDNPVMMLISDLITEMNLERIVVQARSLLDLSYDEYTKARADYLEHLRSFLGNEL